MTEEDDVYLLDDVNFLTAEWLNDKVNYFIWLKANCVLDGFLFTNLKLIASNCEEK